MEDVRVVAGGIIPDADASAVKQQGIAAVFQPGSSLDQIVSFIRSAAGGAPGAPKPPGILLS
jgi:methylmalonyl-CoA mutase, C-terminal domain